MKKSIGAICLALVLLSVLSSGCTSASAPVPSTSTPLPTIDSFHGIWRNTGSNPESWPTVVIRAGEDGTLSANLREACELPEYWSFPTDCDGGTAFAEYSGNPVLMSIDYGDAEYNFTFSISGDTLHVTTFIDYADNSGRADGTSESEYRKELPSFPESEQIVFYYFYAGPRGRAPIQGVRTPILLVTTASDQPYTSDTAADLRAALELVIQDESNGWISRDLKFVDVTFRDGHADMVLEGEYSGESDEVLVAARMQTLLTVFANPSVQSAAVTLNGDTIGNLGVSSIENVKPADYVYTRAEMETYLQEHAYSLEYELFFNK